MTLVSGFQCRRPDVVAAPPDLDLVFAKPLGGLLLVQALEGAVMPFVEAPAAPHRDPCPLHLRQREVSATRAAPGGQCGAVVVVPFVASTWERGSVMKSERSFSILCYEQK